jgi:hypothetical protein
LSGGYQNIVERTHSILNAQFDIFWHPLDYNLEVIPFVVYGLYHLHNFLIDIGKNEDLPTVAMGLGYFGSCTNKQFQVEGEDQVDMAVQLVMTPSLTINDGM